MVKLVSQGNLSISLHGDSSKKKKELAKFIRRCHKHKQNYIIRLCSTKRRTITMLERGGNWEIPRKHKHEALAGAERERERSRLTRRRWLRQERIERWGCCQHGFCEAQDGPFLLKPLRGVISCSVPSFFIPFFFKGNSHIFFWKIVFTAKIFIRHCLRYLYIVEYCNNEKKNRLH
jgi:hypothetical protein